MRSSLVILTALLFTFFGASDLGAQVSTVGGGCVAGGGAANSPVAVGGAPQIGNLNFGISFAAPAGSVACFALFGLCESTPLPDYNPLPPPCATPCGRAVVLNPPPILLGNNIPPTPTTFALPIPNLPGLVGVRVCMQYICFDLVGCTEVSQGVDITIQP